MTSGRTTIPEEPAPEVVSRGPGIQSRAVISEPSPRSVKDLGRALETHFLSKLEYLNAIGVALSQERDINKLLETILIAAKNLTHADGGTLYRLVGDKLQFEIVRTDSLSIAMGGSSGNAVPFYPIPLHSPDGKPNNTMIAAWEASDSASRWSSSPNDTTRPVASSVALSSCSTPMMSPSWFFIGTVRKEVDR